MGRQLREKGFTIVELMIATVVFASVLVVIMAGVLYFSREYYRGVAQTKTQNTARAVVANISQALQFSSGEVVTYPSASPTPNQICVGAKRYTIALGLKVVDGAPASGQAYHGLVADTPSGGCTQDAGLVTTLQTLADIDSAASPIRMNSPQELLGFNMRVTGLEVNRIASTNLYEIKVSIAYGDSDLLTATTGFDVNCKPGAGSQFCATSVLVTTVQKRVNQ